MLIYEKKIKELSEYYDNQIEKTKQENSKLRGTDNVNKRMSVYYERNIEKNDSYESKSYNVFFCLYCDIGFIPFVTLPENLTEN